MTATLSLVMTVTLSPIREATQMVKERSSLRTAQMMTALLMVARKDQRAADPLLKDEDAKSLHERVRYQIA